MTETDIDELIRQTLFTVAPDLEGVRIDPDETFREQFEIDSRLHRLDQAIANDMDQPAKNVGQRPA